MPGTTTAVREVLFPAPTFAATPRFPRQLPLQLRHWVHPYNTRRAQGPAETTHPPAGSLAKIPLRGPVTRLEKFSLHLN